MVQKNGPQGSIFIVLKVVTSYGKHFPFRSRIWMGFFNNFVPSPFLREVTVALGFLLALVYQLPSGLKNMLGGVLIGGISLFFALSVMIMSCIPKKMMLFLF